MKYQSSNTKIIFNVEFTAKRNVCPECSPNRKKKSSRDLEYFNGTNTAYCFHCLTTFFEYKPYEKKEYTKPDLKNKTNLTDKALQWFSSRGITQETLIKCNVYSAKEFMPQHKKEVDTVCFPYYLDNEIINIKYRGPLKSFKLVSNAELVFMNIDCLKKANEVIIVEGEIDYLTFIQNGFENCLSVPNGANKNIEYLDNYIDLFNDVETIYLGTDNDTKGIYLRDELIRRLGSEKCRILNFKECKDANEFYFKYRDEFKELLNNSREVPIKGIINIPSMQNDIRALFDNGIQRGNEINNNEIDQYITWETSRLAIATGIPGSGKSEFVDYIVCRLNLLYQWKAAYFTPENYPLKYHYSKLFEKLIGKPFNKDFTQDIDYDIGYEYIKDNFYYILDEDDLSIDKILENAKILVRQKGIKILVIDPYNKIEHQFDRNVNETQYISKFLDKLIMFGKLNDILIFLIAHPKKMLKGEVPTLYDISGSANFYNKADYGFTIHRVFDNNNLMTNEIELHWQKIKFKHLGSQGVSRLMYNYNNGRFETKQDVNQWDNSNWIIKEPEVPF